MQKIKIVESLGAVHTHTHTHGSLINKGVKVKKGYNMANRPIKL